MSNHTNCPKCAGTGVVATFLHVKDGVCFDCNGTGRIDAAVAKAASSPSGLARARVIADAWIADPANVGDALALSAFADFEAVGARQWRQKDHDRRNALLAVVNK